MKVKGNAPLGESLREPRRTVSAGILRDIISLQQHSEYLFDKFDLNSKSKPEMLQKVVVNWRGSLPSVKLSVFELPSTEVEVDELTSVYNGYLLQVRFSQPWIY